ncbi:MAG TPA: hypothetical protein VK453_00340 [Micromonosporaceae bacterium]|nr:hypothetical protein [Micromonosporaceae bacterium]
MQVEIERVAELRLDTGLPVRAASGIAPFGDGWLIAQDDATHAAWHRPAGMTAIRVLPPVEGHDTFSAAAGTKHLKPDFEAACEVTVAGRPAVLLLGSGSLPARMRASLVTLTDDGPAFTPADLSPLYARVASALEIPIDQLNLEGACRHHDRMHWFQRGNSAADICSTSVDVDFAALLAAVTGAGSIDAVQVGSPRRYDLGRVDGVGLAVTDAVALPDGRTLISAAAEDTPNAVDDGPVVGTALALLDGGRVLGVTALPEPDGMVYKVEGIALQGVAADAARLLAVVDIDDPETPSTELTMTLRWDLPVG